MAARRSSILDPRHVQRKRMCDIQRPAPGGVAPRVPPSKGCGALGAGSRVAAGCWLLAAGCWLLAGRLLAGLTGLLTVPLLAARVLSSRSYKPNTHRAPPCAPCSSSSESVQKRSGVPPNASGIAANHSQPKSSDLP